MPTYKVVFRNGDNKRSGEELTIDAIRVDASPSDGTIKFVRQAEPNIMYSAVVPIDRVLYVQEIKQ